MAITGSPTFKGMSALGEGTGVLCQAGRAEPEMGMADDACLGGLDR